MDPLKKVLHGVFQDLMKKQKEIDYQKALDVWERVAGAKAFAHTQIVYLTKEQIRINVNSSAWLYELNLKKEKIQKELEKALQIKEVKFRLGEVKERG